MINKDYLDQFLTGKEQNLLEQFANHEEMVDAVRKVLLFGLYNSGVLQKGKPHDPLKNFALSIACVKNATPEEIGRDVKACWEGINELEMAFNRINMYKSIPMPEKLKNPAR